MAVPPELSDRDREILDFERQWWRYPAAKETTILERFDMTATRYFQVLNALIERPEALEYDAQLVNRLRRVQAARRRQRSHERLPSAGALAPLHQHARAAEHVELHGGGA